MLFDVSKILPPKHKTHQLSRDGLPRFSGYVLSAPQADVKSALIQVSVFWRLMSINRNDFELALACLHYGLWGHSFLLQSA